MTARTKPNVRFLKQAQNQTKEGMRGRGVKRYTPWMACVERSGTRQRLYAAAPYSLLTAPIPRSTDEKKPAFSSRFLQIWSAREDSNLRPTGPKPVALPSCATRRCGAHLTAGGYRRQSLFCPCISSGDKSAIMRCAGGCAAYFAQALAGFSAGVCARRNGSRNSADRQAAMEITTKKPFQCQISITRAIG